MEKKVLFFDATAFKSAETEIAEFKKLLQYICESYEKQRILKSINTSILHQLVNGSYLELVTMLQTQYKENLDLVADGMSELSSEKLPKPKDVDVGKFDRFCTALKQPRHLARYSMFQIDNGQIVISDKHLEKIRLKCTAIETPQNAKMYKLYANLAKAANACYEFESEQKEKLKQKTGFLPNYAIQIFPGQKPGDQNSCILFDISEKKYVPNLQRLKFGQPKSDVILPRSERITNTPGGQQSPKPDEKYKVKRLTKLE